MHDREIREYYCVSRIECIVGGYVESSMRAANAFQLVEIDSPEDLREKAYNLGKGSTIGCFIEHLEGKEKVISHETVDSISFSGELLSTFAESTGGDYNSLSFRYKDNMGVCKYEMDEFGMPCGELHCGEKKN